MKSWYKYTHEDGTSMMIDISKVTSMLPHGGCDDYKKIMLELGWNWEVLEVQ